jgi:uncharacterized protein YndB with AHSA1/START domain/ketosteroid isomerase-like protein
MPESGAKRSEGTSDVGKALTFTRVVEAPRELVFQAWTDAGILAQWWGPHGFTNPLCEFDARPGGALRIHMRGPDGVVYRNRGVVHEIVRPERLVFTCVHEGADGQPLLAMLNSVTFAEDSGKTKITLHVRVTHATAEAAPMLGGMEAGWSETLERLDTFTNKAASEAQIRALIDARVEAVRDKNVQAAMAYHSPDAVLFDLINPLRYVGSSAGSKRAEEWFSSFEGPLGYEIRELSVAAGDDVAFSHGINHVKATRTDGEQLEMWWRSTVCYQKMAGKWAITHEHGSAPFDRTTGKASLGLKP